MYVPLGNEADTDHRGVRIYRSTKSNDAQTTWSPDILVDSSTDAGFQEHAHATFQEHAEADRVRYRAAYLDILGAPGPYGPYTECDTDLGWAAGAENAQGTGQYAEWADLSAASPSRGAIVTSPKLKGSHAYSCTVIEGDQAGGNYERCEWGQANAPSSSSVTSERLFANLGTYWSTYAVYIPDTLLYCPNPASCIEGDGGSIEQTKQLGGYGTPALTTVAKQYDAGAGGEFLELFNSRGNTDESGTMPRLWQLAIEENRWIKILQRVKISTSPTTGFVETWADADGNGSTTWTAVPANFSSSNITSQTVTSNVTADASLPPVDRINTWTTKNGDAPAGKCDTTIGNWPCSHKRLGLYRGGNGTSGITGDSTVYHDSVASGTNLATVLAAAY